MWRAKLALILFFAQDDPYQPEVIPRMAKPKNYGVQTICYQVGPWSQRIGKSVSFVQNLIKRDILETVKIGGSRHIITPPEEYIRRLVEEQRKPEIDLTQYSDDLRRVKETPHLGLSLYRDAGSSGRVDMKHLSEQRKAVP